MRTIRIRKAFSVEVWRDVEIDKATSIAELEAVLDKLEHDASLDLSNIGQEVSYESSYVSMNDAIEFLEEEA